VTVTESSIGHTTQQEVDSSEDSIDSVVMVGRTVRADAKVVNTSSGSSSGCNGRNIPRVVDKLTSLLKGDLHLKKLSIVHGGEITIDKGVKLKPLSSSIASLSDSNDSLQASSDPTDDDDDNNGRGVGYFDDDHDDDEDDDDDDDKDHDIDESSDNDEVESYSNNHRHDEDGNKRGSTSINNTVHKNKSDIQVIEITKISSSKKKGAKIKNYGRKRASKQHHHQQQQHQQSRFITFYRYVERMIVQSLIFRQLKRRLQVITRYIRVLFVTMMTRNTKRESLLFAILYSVSIVILMHVLSKLASTITTLYISHYSTIQSDDVLRILNIHHDGTLVINTSAVVNRTTDHYSSIMNMLRPITSSTRSSSSSKTSSPLPTTTISSSSSSYIDASAYQTTVVVPTHWVRDGESISFGDFTHLNHDLNNIHTLDRVANILPTAALKDRVVERYQWTRDGENGLWLLSLINICSMLILHSPSSPSSSSLSSLLSSLIIIISIIIIIISHHHHHHLHRYEYNQCLLSTAPLHHQEVEDSRCGLL
jgi:hypothetical protein